MTTVAKRIPLTDQEIESRLMERTDGELIAFREKLMMMDTPQAWGLRFAICKVLLSRAISA